MRIQDISLCLICVSSLAVGQILFKLAAQNNRNQPPTDFVANLLATPYLIIALLLYVLTTFLWIWILRNVPLSLAYSFNALAFIFVPLLASFIFREPLTIRVILGGVVIICGVYLVGSSK